MEIRKKELTENMAEIKSTENHLKRSGILSIVEELRKDKEILAALLFGSLAQERASALSDKDICLVLNDEKFDREHIFKKRILYLGKFNFDISIFQELPLYIRKRVLRDGVVLYVRDEDKLYDIAFKTITEFSDFEHIYREYLEEIESAG